MPEPSNPEPSNPKQPKGATPVPPRGKKGGGGRPGSGRPGQARPRRGKPVSGRQARQAALQRRNRNLALAAVAAVVVIVLVVVLIATNSGSSSGSLRQTAPAAAVTKVENIPTSVLTSAVGDATLEPAVTAKGGAVTTSSKPELLFIGAEFCPICATERWPMVIALSKFGKFTNLQQTHSALDDGDIGTWSFYGASYTSPYFTFTPVEAENNKREALQTPTKAQVALWSANTDESFPFIDFNATAVLTTAQPDPDSFEQLSFDTILDDVGNNSNTIGASVDAAAAVFMKHICTMISDKAPVCSSVSSVSAPVTSTSSGASSSSS